MDEQTLIEGLEANDPEAVRALYDQYHDRIFSVVRSNVRDEWDAEEVTQDVIWKVYQKIDTFRQNSALWSWMYRIAVNEARMKTRQYHRHPVPVEDDVLTAVLEDENEHGRQVRPDEKLAVKDVLRELEAHLEESKETNTTVYLKMEFDGAPKEKLAEDFDLSPAAVKARLHRMRVGVRERIREKHLSKVS